jgi:hypothetical protein
LAIIEKSQGPNHTSVAAVLNNLALLLLQTNRFAGAEPLSRRAVAILCDFYRRNGHDHPSMKHCTQNYVDILRQLGRNEPEIKAELEKLKCREP